MSNKLAKTDQNSEQLPELPPLNIDLKDVGKPQRQREFSVQKRRKFFRELMRDFNFARAAHAAKISYAAVKRTLERDPKFKAKYDEVEQAILDCAVSANVLVSSIASREGFQDRRLLLEAKHPDYQKNGENQINIQVNVHQAGGELHNLVGAIPLTESLPVAAIEEATDAIVVPTGEEKSEETKKSKGKK